MKVTLYTITYEDYYYWGSDEAKYHELVEPFVKAGMEVFPFNVAEDNKYHYFLGKDAQHASILVDRDRISWLAICGVRFKVIGEIGTEVDIGKELSAMAEKQVTFTQPSQEFNDVVNVHISGNQLSTFNDIMLLEDHCTDELATQINKGWRIIAVCPQPDQRRPDYILGRWNPDIEITDYAKR